MSRIKIEDPRSQAARPNVRLAVECDSYRADDLALAQALSIQLRLLLTTQTAEDFEAAAGSTMHGVLLLSPESEKTDARLQACAAHPSTHCVPLTLDSTGDVGLYSSIAVDRWGLAHVAYWLLLFAATHWPQHPNLSDLPGSD